MPVRFNDSVFNSCGEKNEYLRDERIYKMRTRDFSGLSTVAIAGTFSTGTSVIQRCFNEKGSKNA